MQYRRADAGDVIDVTSVITSAFVTDPLWGWALARADGDTSHHATLWRVFVEGALQYPWTWLTAGGEAAALWIPPGGSDLSAEHEQRLSTLARDVLGARSDLYFELLEMFAAAHPKAEPHYYLSLLATQPRHRGHGFGMALLRHGLELIDEEGLPAYLESSNPANNNRYASVGFEPLSEFRAPNDGPEITTMWRPGRQ